MTAAPPPSTANPTPLVVRLRNWVGDVVLSVPTLQRLQASGFELHLVGKGWAGDLLAGFGWQVHKLPAGHLERLGQLQQLRRSLSSAGRRPVGLTFPYSFSSALEMRLSGLRPTGFAYEGRSLLLRQAVPRPAGLHTLEEYWALGSAFLGSEAPVPAIIEWPLHATAVAQAQALQAMACGTPVLASAVGAHIDIVVDGITGTLVPPRQVDPMAAALRRLVDDPFTLQSMGIAGSDRAQHRFAWTRVAQETLRVYRAIDRRMLSLAVSR